MILGSAQGFSTPWSLTTTEPEVSTRTLSQPMKCTSVTLRGKKRSSTLTKTTLSKSIVFCSMELGLVHCQCHKIKYRYMSQEAIDSFACPEKSKDK